MDADGSATELYDLSEDFGEAENVAASDPQRAERLTSMLLKSYRALPVSPHGQ